MDIDKLKANRKEVRDVVFRGLELSDKVKKIVGKDYEMYFDGLNYGFKYALKYMQNYDVAIDDYLEDNEINKKQTTLPAFDKKGIKRNVGKKNSNVFIAAKEGNKAFSKKELSDFSDALLKDLTKLNKNLRMNNKKQFTITSATGNAEWELEPSFMLTNVPEEAMPMIFKLAKKYKQDSIAVSNKNETGASFVTPEGKVTDKYKKMVFDANALYSTDFPTGQRLTFKKQTYTESDITFKEMSEDGAVKAFQDDGYFDYQKRSMRYGPNLSKDSIWATAPARMFVAFDGETPVAVCGMAKYKNILLGAGIHTREGYKRRGLFGLCVEKIIKEKGGNTIYINVANPKLAEMKSFRKRGFTDMKVEELPEEIQEELEGTKYPDQVQKWIKSNNGSWFGLLKSDIRKKRDKARMFWIKMGNQILQDKIPFSEPKKYVKYSNLGRDNKRAIRFYLEDGLDKPERRNAYYSKLQEEMLRSSNVRYDVEDQSRGDR